MAWPGYNNTHTTDPRPPLSWARCLMKSTCTDGHQTLLTDEAYNGQRAGAARIAARIAANSGASASAHAACPGRAPVHAKQLAVFSRRVMCLGRAATCCLIYTRMAACDLGKLIAIGDDWGPIMCWLNSLVGCQIVIQWLQLADRISNHFGNTFLVHTGGGSYPYQTPAERPLVRRLISIAIAWPYGNTCRGRLGSGHASRMAACCICKHTMMVMTGVQYCAGSAH